MLKWFRTILGTCALCVFLWSGSHVARYMLEAKASRDVTSELAHAAVSVTAVSPLPDDSASSSAIPAENGAKEAPVTVDFAALQAMNGDIFAWLYSEGTEISYPVAHAEDNDKYLRTLPDGSYNTAGTLFADCHNAVDMSSWNTVIYGHNMANDTMFGTLYSYNNPGYYEAHPVLWLITADAAYRVELFAGFDTPDDSEVYTVFENAADAYAVAHRAAERSVFRTDVVPQKGDRFVTLSTCSYAYENARFVLMGRLVRA